MKAEILSEILFLLAAAGVLWLCAEGAQPPAIGNYYEMSLWQDAASRGDPQLAR